MYPHEISGQVRLSRAMPVGASLCRRRTPRVLLAAFTAVLASVSPGMAQTLPWIVFPDEPTGLACGVVNAENAQLVVLLATGQLAVVTGEDLTLADTFVDAFLFVSDGGVPAGRLAFAEDGDGVARLWWTSLTGRVIHVDDLTAEPSASDLFPMDFTDVPCDACALWDDPAVCGDDADDGNGNGNGNGSADGDSDADGIDDEDDLCPGTPPEATAYDNGCSCSQLDGDFDGIDNCRDLCATTPIGEEVNIFGCRGAWVPLVNLCGSLGGLALVGMIFGLFALRFVYR